MIDKSSDIQTGGRHPAYIKICLLNRISWEYRVYVLAQRRVINPFTVNYQRIHTVALCVRSFARRVSETAHPRIFGECYT